MKSETKRRKSIREQSKKKVDDEKCKLSIGNSKNEGLDSARAAIYHLLATVATLTSL